MKESNNSTVKAMPVAKRLAAAMCAAALAAATMGAPLAFADYADVVNSVDNGTAANATKADKGSTDLVVRLVDPVAHATDDTNWANYANVNVSYPAKMDYVVDKDGVLTGPTSGVKFQNNAEHALSVTGLLATPVAVGASGEKFTIIEKSGYDAASTATNQLYLELGPDGGVLDLGGFKATSDTDTATKAISDAGKAKAWKMSFKGEASGKDALEFVKNEGKMQNISDKVTNAIQGASGDAAVENSEFAGAGAKFATITWQVAPKAVL